MRRTPPEGMQYNPNEKIVQAIERRLEITGGQCPCVAQTEWNDDTLCFCKKAREHRECCCNLLVPTGA